MTQPEKFPAGGEQPPDLAAIIADTLLLDTLGRGEPAPEGDEVAALLAAWRADLDLDTDLDTDLDADADRDADRLTSLGMSLDAGAAPAIRPGRPAEDPSGATAIPIPIRRRRRRSRVLAGIAAAVVLVVAGGLVAAANAGPGSPLWPITRVVYPDQADTLAAEHTIGQARKAAAEGRYDDARRLLDLASAQVAKVRDPKQAARLRAEIDEIRRSIPATTSNTGAVPPGTTLTPGAPGATAGPGAGGASGGGGSTPGGNGNGGVQVPGLPTTPAPSLPVPVPSLPLPTSVPGLPTPTILPSLPLGL
jgi:hypothetical protein